MTLVNEKLPKEISQMFSNETINLIYSYSGNSQYDVVLKQLKNIIESSIHVIRDKRRFSSNFNIIMYRYILSKNNYKMYLNGIRGEMFIQWDSRYFPSGFTRSNIFPSIILEDPVFNNIIINLPNINEEIYIDTESESDSDSDSEMPDLIDLNDIIIF